MKGVGMAGRLILFLFLSSTSAVVEVPGLHEAKKIACSSSEREHAGISVTALAGYMFNTTFATWSEVMLVETTQAWPSSLYRLPLDFVERLQASTPSRMRSEGTPQHCPMLR